MYSWLKNGAKLFDLFYQNFNLIDNNIDSGCYCFDSVVFQTLSKGI